MIDFELLSSLHLLNVLLMAVLIDLTIGEPPTKLHPVVWIGNLIYFFKRNAPASCRLAYGVFIGVSCMAFASAIALIVLWIASASWMPEIGAIFIEAFFLKCTFAIKRLLYAGDEIDMALRDEGLDAARQKLSMYVSRDTSKLNEGSVSSAAIETMSENFVDSILTPLFYYAIFGPLGLVAAYAYKAVSTLDSMVGYKDEEHIKMGKFSARLDDVLNWPTARLSVVFIVAASLILNVLKRSVYYASEASACAFRDCRVPSSPNSGYPMAAFAGALKIKLEKPGTYVLGQEYSLPDVEDIGRASQLILATALLSVAALSLLILTVPDVIINLIG
ncbi:adenosylcobinamide-phosphate synthase [Methanohalophilus levihalophilus]|uniref:cobalamin biosynthesis protein n=1 Tax=Methanohalophilus levihalophilus TaxID=1431282 RepID=UPI001AEAF498|nr:cobalamin biosynthesis protein [Methanohalophilus levihalophilus]MBP2030184.1 adenosylcobinamide-phosphate synthase [Methanohalophilus levihalophilus]